jgi:hypothetical protein
MLSDAVQCLRRIGDRSGDGFADAQCIADIDTFNDLIETAPTTFAGLQAWAAHLNDIRHVEAWMFEDNGPTLVATLVEALGNLAVTS